MHFVYSNCFFLIDDWWRRPDLFRQYNIWSNKVRWRCYLHLRFACRSCKNIISIKVIQVIQQIIQQWIHMYGLWYNNHTTCQQQSVQVEFDHYPGETVKFITLKTIAAKFPRLWRRSLRSVLSCSSLLATMIAQVSPPGRTVTGIRKSRNVMFQTTRQLW